MLGPAPLSLAEPIPDSKYQVGMGATEHRAPDCFPYTVIQVVNDKKLLLQLDRSVRIDKNGKRGPQIYEYYRDIYGDRIHVSLRKNGKWVPVGLNMQCGRNFYIGKRRRFVGSQSVSVQPKPHEYRYKGWIK